ncbi:MAG: TIGR00730 family Rossman fold protein [Chloroflexi bacterium]|nr:TIGR00730 family Rossman fold protein [Chloroflexota bacterium]MCC6892799.1 TIGR00730 family Rossman fold protein [Anaerolineae bacterium]
MKQVCIFCGSYAGAQPVYMQAARAIGLSLAKREIGLVYGGGKVGLMGAIADGALEGGGQVLGIIPQSLVDRELAHKGLTELQILSSMHERKAAMAQVAEGFIALPGGFGTLDELFEIITWAQLGFHRKPVALLNVAGYFNPLLAFIDHMATEGFIKPEHRGAILVRNEVEDLLDTLVSYQPPELEKWIKKPEEL